MTRLLTRGISFALAGGISAAALFVICYVRDPSITFDLDDQVPDVLTGLYPAERDGSGLTFAWTGADVELRLLDLDRRVPWHLTVRMSAGRPDPTTLPNVDLAVDGVLAYSGVTPNTFEDLAITLPLRDDGRRGVTVSIRVSNTFTPGSGDSRALGVVVDRIVLAPAGIALPPRGALAAASLAGAFLGAGMAMVGLTVVTGLLAVSLLATGQAVVLATGVAPYLGAPLHVPWLAGWIAVGLVMVNALARRLAGAPLRNTARFVLAFSAASLYLKLIVLLHPSLPIGDALFHAHRFSNVVRGTYYFTSIAPGGYTFPYPVGLYVASLPFVPWAHTDGQQMALLRIMVASADAVAGGLLYLMVVRAWGDRLGGAMAVALYHLIPLDFRVMTVGNLTNVFGQAFFLATMAAITTGTLRRNMPLQVLSASLLVTVASLSHTSTFAMLLVVVLMTAASYRVFGGESLRRGAAGVLSVGAIGSIVAVATYYGHFGDTYRTEFTRIITEILESPGTADPAQRTIGTRLALVPYSVNLYFGWPALLLATVGAWQLWRSGTRDRLGLALLGWMTTCGLFLVLGVLTPIDMRYYLSGFPAVALLAGVAASRGWRSGGPSRAATIVVLSCGVWIGTRAWTGWLGP